MLRAVRPAWQSLETLGILRCKKLVDHVPVGVLLPPPTQLQSHVIPHMHNFVTDYLPQIVRTYHLETLHHNKMQRITNSEVLQFCLCFNNHGIICTIPKPAN